MLELDYPNPSSYGVAKAFLLTLDVQQSALCFDTLGQQQWVATVAHEALWSDIIYLSRLENQHKCRQRAEAIAAIDQELLTQLTVFSSYGAGTEIFASVGELAALDSSWVISYALGKEYAWVGESFTQEQVDKACMRYYGETIPYRLNPKYLEDPQYGGPCLSYSQETGLYHHDGHGLPSAYMMPYRVVRDGEMMRVTMEIDHSITGDEMKDNKLVRSGTVREYTLRLVDGVWQIRSCAAVENEAAWLSPIWGEDGPPAANRQ